MENKWQGFSMDECWSMLIALTNSEKLLEDEGLDLLQELKREIGRRQEENPDEV